MTSSVGAVIVSWNSGDLVNRACDALLSGELAPTRIVVVDNASTEPSSLTALDRLPAEAEVLRQPTNEGFCGGNNIGIRALGGVDHVLLCNPDAFVSVGFLRGAVAHLDQHPDVGVVGPKLLSIDADATASNGLIDSTGIVQTWYGRFVDRGQGRSDDGRFDGPAEEVPALCAAAAVYRLSALQSVSLTEGPFDERFFMYKEDIDLSLRLRRSGWRVVLRSDLVVLHRRGLARDARPAASGWARRRSVLNEWRVWRRGTLPLLRRLSMLPYLTAKSILVLAGW